MFQNTLLAQKEVHNLYLGTYKAKSAKSNKKPFKETVFLSLDISFNVSGTFLFAGEFRGGRLWGKGLLSYHDGSPGTEGYFQARLEKYYKFGFISDKKTF